MTLRDEKRGKRRPAPDGGEPTGPPRRKPGEKREDQPDERDHPVPELDDGMEVPLRVGVVAAPRPVLASEPRPRQPDERTGRDDHEERRARGGCDPEEPGWRKSLGGERAKACRFRASQP